LDQGFKTQKQRQSRIVVCDVFFRSLGCRELYLLEQMMALMEGHQRGIVDIFGERTAIFEWHLVFFLMQQSAKIPS
jgi:hypothetical protein